MRLNDLFSAGFLAAEQFNNNHHRDDDISNLTSLDPHDKTHDNPHHKHNDKPPYPSEVTAGSNEQNFYAKASPARRPSQLEQQERSRHPGVTLQTELNYDDIASADDNSATYEVFAKPSDPEQRRHMGCDAGGPTKEFLEETMPSLLFPPKAAKHNHRHRHHSAAYTSYYANQNKKNRNDSRHSFSNQRSAQEEEGSDEQYHHPQRASSNTSACLGSHTLLTSSNDSTFSRQKPQPANARIRRSSQSLQQQQPQHRKEEHARHADKNYHFYTTTTTTPSSPLSNSHRRRRRRRREPLEGDGGCMDFGRRLGECMMAYPSMENMYTTTTTTTTTNKDKFKSASMNGESSMELGNVTTKCYALTLSDGFSDENSVVDEEATQIDRLNEKKSDTARHSHSLRSAEKEESFSSVVDPTLPRIVPPLPKHDQAYVNKKDFPLPASSAKTTDNDGNAFPGQAGQHASSGKGEEAMRDFRLQRFHGDNTTDTMVPRARLARALSEVAVQDELIQKLHTELVQAKIELVAAKTEYQQIEETHPTVIGNKHATMGSIKNKGENLAVNASKQQDSGGTLQADVSPASSSPMSLQAQIVLLKSLLADLNAGLLEAPKNDSTASEFSFLRKEVQTLQGLLYCAQEKVDPFEIENQALLQHERDAPKLERGDGKNASGGDNDSYMVLHSKFEEAQSQIHDLSKAKGELSQALKKSKDQVSHMRNQVFTNKLKLAQAESRAEALEYVATQARKESSTAQSRAIAAGPVDGCEREGGSKRDNPKEGAAPEKALKQSLELEEATQEIVSLRLQLAKSKSDNEMNGCPHSAELAELDRLRFSVCELQQKTHLFLARERQQRELLESESRRFQMEESELVHKCLVMETELEKEREIAREAEYVKLQLKQAQSELTAATAETEILKEVVRETEHRCKECEESKRDLENKTDDASSRLLQLQSTLAFQREMSSRVADFYLHKYTVTTAELTSVTKELRRAERLYTTIARKSVRLELLAIGTVREIRIFLGGGGGAEQAEAPPSEKIVDNRRSPDAQLYNENDFIRGRSDDISEERKNFTQQTESLAGTKPVRKHKKLSDELLGLLIDLNKMSKCAARSASKAHAPGKGRSALGDDTSPTTSTSKAEEVKLKLRGKEKELSQKFSKYLSKEGFFDLMQERKEANKLLQDKILYLDECLPKAEAKLQVLEDKLSHANRCNASLPRSVVLDGARRGDNQGEQSSLLQEANTAQVESSEERKAEHTTRLETELSQEELQKSSERETCLTVEMTALQTQLAGETNICCGPAAFSESAKFSDPTLRRELEEILLLLKNTKEWWQEDTTRFEEEQRNSKQVEVDLLAQIHDLKTELKFERRSAQAGKDDSVSRSDSPVARLLAKASMISQRKIMHDYSSPHRRQGQRAPADKEPPICSLFFKTPQRDNRSQVSSTNAFHLHSRSFDEVLKRQRAIPVHDSNSSVSTVTCGKARSEFSAEVAAPPSESETKHMLGIPHLADDNSWFSPIRLAAADTASVASESSMLSPPLLSATALLSNLPEPVPIRPEALARRALPWRSASSNSRPLELVSKLKLFFENSDGKDF